MTLTIRNLFCIGLGFCSVFGSSAIGQTSQAAPPAQSRCEQSFGQEPIDRTLQTCREELTAPVSRFRRVAILETLGKVYLAQKEPALAIKTWNEASQFSQLNRSDSESSESWARLQVLIAQTKATEGQVEEADQYFQATLRKVEEGAGRFSVAAGLVQDAMGTHLALHNQAARADEAFRKARIIYEVRLGKDNLRTLETRMNRAVGMLDASKEDEARESFEALATQINGLPQYANTSIRAEILTFLGTLQMRNEELSAAVRNYQTAFEVRQNVFGPTDIRTSQSLNNLGVVLFRSGDLAGAERALSRAYIIRKDALGDQDSLTLSTQRNLQAVIAAQNSAQTR